MSHGLKRVIAPKGNKFETEEKAPIINKLGDKEFLH